MKPQPQHDFTGDSEGRRPVHPTTMALRKINTKRWQQLVDESARHRAELLGWSPGGAAAELGISRQAVHLAIKRGDLDAVMVTGEDGKLQQFMIPDASLRAFAALRASRGA